MRYRKINKKKLLWISPYVPYDQVRHAGGKTHNYYIKYFQRTGLFDIHLLTLAQQRDKKYIDLDKYGVSYRAAVLDGGLLKNSLRILLNANSVFNSRHRLCQTILSYHYNCLKKMIRQYSVNNVPDIIIMQWTGAGFLLPFVQKLFPYAYTVIIEEDVTFLGYERRYLQERNYIKKTQYKIRYERLKKKELQLLNHCNLVVVNNDKDRDLLVKSGIEDEKICSVLPYYQDYSNLCRNKILPNIIYYGAMDREENHKAAMWLIRNVMPLIKDIGIELYIIGANPKEELKKMETEQIHIKGFVKEISEHFEHAMCMAVPLLLGAGIKVKVLEGMSAGIPVLTNSIGIEGIPVKNKREYYHCETAEEYATAIRFLYNNETVRDCIGLNAKRFMLDHFKIDEKLDGLINRILKESQDIGDSNVTLL